MSQVSMQSRPASASHQHSWGQLPNGRNDCSQAQPLGGLNPSSPWQQTPTAQWDVQSSQPGLPGMDLRAIMQEEQQAAVQGRARLTHHAGNNSRHDSANSFLTSTDAAMHYPGLGQQAQPHLSQQQMPQQQMPQQQQRSGGFYMRNKRDESVPVKQNWAQVLNRPSQQAAPHPLSGMGGMENGLVDLQMATEAFRDAFSATAPSLEGPVDSEQDYLLVEAYKSPANPITGNVHCLGCGKAFKEYITLAQHLKDKHQGRNADTMSTRPGLTLGDIMAQAHAKQAAAPAKALAAERHQKQYSAFTPGDSRGMREYLKRFPNKASLAMAVHKELGGGSHSKKKTSRLKRIILRERADKAATQAGIAAEQATDGLAKSKTALESLQKQLKEAEAQLDEGKVGFVEATALTHKQVLEMAVAEASRRVHEATKLVTDAETEVTKKAEERAKIWKTKAGSNTTSSNTTPNTSVEIIPKSASATSSKAEHNSLTHPADPAEETAAAEPELQPSADDQYVAEQLKLIAASFEQDADRDQHEDSGSDTSSGDAEDEEGRGLEAFEDVLSSWLTAAHSKTSRPFVKAQASLPLKPRSGGGGGAGGGQSTLARIQEQQQQLMKEEEKVGSSSGLAASNAQQAAARGEGKRPVEKAPVAAVGGDSAVAAEEDEEPESPTGIEGWKDVLSNWMTTAGVTAPSPHAQQAGTKASRTSAGKGAHKEIASMAGAKAAKAAEAPAWLADVSSDEEEAGAGTEVTPPRTSSITEQQLKAAVSRELSSEARKQSAASFNSAQQQQPQHAQHAAISNASAAAFPPSSPLQGHSVPLQGLVGSSGVSSRDLRLDGDLLGRARSDPAALWNNSVPGFPPRSSQEPQLPPAVATSLPAPMYPADQGLPPQALQNWKEQFKGLYRSFGAEQPAQQFVTVPNPAFAPQRLEPPPGFTANSHEFECTVCSVTCCGIINFEQHCTSKKHLRKAAAVAHATVSNNSLFLPGNDATPTASQSSDAANGTTYVGIKAQCRTYCKQVISGDLNRVVVELLQQLLFWQERQKAQDPLKAAKKKRLVSGLREVAKAVKLRKAKTVVVAPNIEQIESEGGLDDLLGSILKQADEFGLPVVFALSRKKMGQVFGCRKKMSAIAILDYGGANELFNQMSALAQKGREDYQLYYEEEAPNGNSDIDPMGLTHSDSDSSQEAFAQEAEPVLYRLRADGRKVPITDGHGMDLARRKGLIQEVEVSPKNGGRSATKSAFGAPHTTQPETVALHSIELPQVQLGDREIADSPPEKAGDAEAAGVGVKAAKPFNLHTNPSLLQLQQQQQQRQQSQTDKLMTQCGLKPQDDSSHSLRSSQMLSASKPFGTMPESSSHSMGRIDSMSNFPPHSPQVPDMARNSSVDMAPSPSAASLPPGYMPWWGMANSSAPLPNQAAVQAQASRSLPLGHNPAMSPYLSGAPMPAGPPRVQPEGYGQTSAHPGMPLGARCSVLGAFASSPRAPSMGHLGGNRAPERSAAAAQGFNAVPGSVPWPLGQGFCPLRPGPTPHTALGHGDLTGANGLYDNSYGGGQQPAALPPSPTGYGAAYSQSDPYAGYSGYPGSHLVAAPQANQPWQDLQQQQQQSDWAQQAQQAQHMHPYQQSQEVGAQSHRDHHHQQQQQQQMMHNMPQHQLNAHAQEWKPRWA